MADNQQVSYTCCTPLKRESIVRMMMVSQKNADGAGQQQRQSVSLVMVSAKGRVAVYDVSLKLAAAFTLRLSSAPVASIKAPLSIPSAASGTSASNSRPNAPAAAPSTAITSYNAGSSQKKVNLSGWITDCVHMDEFNSLVVASSGRCLHFFTTVVTPFVERFRLDGMKDIPTSLAYMAPALTGRSEPLLGVGDDEGDVFVLRFLKASTSLFKKREADGEIQHIYWRELHLQAGMVTLTIMPGCHDSPVLQVDLKRTMLRVVSCSKNSTTSLVIRHLCPQSGGMNTLPSVTLRTSPGVTCFDYDDEKGLIVSGSTDGNIRLWSPTHLAKPWMVLSGHAATISAVCLVKQSEFLWSLSDQAELRYWNLSEGKCVNTIQLAFSTGNKEDRVQFSCQRPLLASKQHVLYVVCGDSVATVLLGKSPLDGQGSRIVEAVLGFGRQEDSEGNRIAGAESKIPYRFREDLLDFGYHGEDDVFNKFITDLKKVFADSVTASQRLKEVERTGVKSLVKSSTDDEEPGPVYEWEVELAKVPAVPPELVPLNQIKLKEMEGKEIMKKHVKDGTPFCGLRLHEPSQIELPKGLPVTGRMKKHGIKSLSTLREVREANFDLFSDQMQSLSSARTSLLSSVLSYYKKKRVGDKATPFSGEGDLLMVSARSQQSSRKSSIASASSLSPSSAASVEE